MPSRDELIDGMTDVSTNKTTEKDMLEWLERVRFEYEVAHSWWNAEEDEPKYQAIRTLIQSASSASQPCGCKSAGEMWSEERMAIHERNLDRIKAKPRVCGRIVDYEIDGEIHTQYVEIECPFGFHRFFQLLDSSLLLSSSLEREGGD